MTKEELEEKIKNGEIVWIVNNNKPESRLAPLLLPSYVTDKIFSTKEQTEHYLKNANVTRTEILPYVTWEEFKNGKEFLFTDSKGNECEFISFENFEGIECIEIVVAGNWYFKDYIPLTEENFYKAYEVCRKLFLGDRNERRSKTCLSR